MVKIVTVLCIEMPKQLTIMSNLNETMRTKHLTTTDVTSNRTAKHLVMVKTNITQYKIGQFDEWRLTYSAELIKIPIEKQNEAHLDAI